MAARDDTMRRDRLIVLDGMHRLLNAELQARQTIVVHIVGLELFAEHVVELSSLEARR